MRLAIAILAAVSAGAQDRAREILRANCLPCHDDATRSSGLSVMTAESLVRGGARFGPAVVGGMPADSPLVRVLTGQASPRMPLGRPPLSGEEIQAVSAWIAAMPPSASSGAKPWAFTKPASAGRDIDAMVRSGGELGRAQLQRRLHADLVGLPPTPEQTRAFAESTAPDAYERLVDSLLADPRFGERWGRHWLDLARYADTQGFEADRENTHMWRYRDYVIDAFNRDKPYDQFVREQIAGDEIGTPEGRAAVGFLRLTPRFQATNAQELRQTILDEITATVGGVFLGLTVKCAQCHDHRYDPIPQRDFYRLQAFFNTIEMVELPQPFADAALQRRMDTARADTAERLKQAQRRFDDHQRALFAKLEATGAKLPADDRPVAATALAADEVSTESFVRPMTARLAALEARIGRVIANGVVPNEEDSTFTLDEKKRYLELLSHVDGNRGGRDMGTLQREIRRYAPTIHTVRNIPNDPNRPALPSTFVRLMGDFNKPGEAVQPGFPSAIEGHSEPAPLTTDQFGNPRGWRLPLARWIASPDNPLTARVMANRVWQHLFGTGLVATPSDFGRNGSPPTHPELLDHLAMELVRGKWSVKALIKTIVMSRAYRRATFEGKTRRRRLEGEIIRDHMLAVSGALNPEQGGPGAFIKLPEAMRDRMTIKNFATWTPSDGPETNKRSIYVFQRRQLEVPLFGVMDAPVFQVSCDRRAVSTTPLQALTLMNDDFALEQSRRFADRIRREVGPDPGERVEHAFRLAFARLPDAEEKARGLGLPLESLCRALFNANEFVYVD
jgi:hypothetical protein